MTAIGGLQWCTVLVPCTRENSSASTRVPWGPPLRGNVQKATKWQKQQDVRSRKPIHRKASVDLHIRVRVVTYTATSVDLHIRVRVVTFTATRFTETSVDLHIRVRVVTFTATGVDLHIRVRVVTYTENNVCRGDPDRR